MRTYGAYGLCSLKWVTPGYYRSLVAPHGTDDVLRDREILKSKYQMADLGEISWMLGIHITRDREEGWITLSQKKYPEVLARSGSCSTHTE